jgi:PPM family protein phosphatase
VREARVGDRYLLCSDGLSGVVSEDTLRETLAGNADPEDAVDRLVELALRGGGPDNITAIVADVVEVEASPSAVPVVVGAAAAGTNRRTEGSSAAAKAAALTPQLDEDDDFVDDERTTHPVRRFLLALLVLAVLGGGGYGAWRWSQQQYYVGAEGEHVAIFRGLSQDIGPLHTSKVYAEQPIALTDLPDYQQDRVRADIAANDLSDAQRIVRTLRRQAEICRAAAASASPSSTPSSTPTSTGSPSAKPKPTGTARPPSPTPSPSSPASASSATPDPATADCAGDGS